MENKIITQILVNLNNEYIKAGTSAQILLLQHKSDLNN